MDKSVSSRHTQKNRGFLPSVFVGTLLALSFGAALLFLFSGADLMLDDPVRYAPAFAFGALALTAVFGGRFSARRFGQSGVLCGIFSGILLLALIAVVPLALSWEIRLPVFAVGAPAVLLLSALSGALALRARPGKRRRKKHRF